MAGHVDHGKSSIVRQLTGNDTSRLEERRRGLTIDLGFDYFETAHGSVSVIDVPGHESFINNMVSGAHGFDVALLVISAKDGIQRQTVEHLQILRAFEVRCIAVVISKCDLSDEAACRTLQNEVAKLFSLIPEEALPPFFFVSAKQATGFSLLREWIEKKRSECQRDLLTESLPFRMPIDRCFKKEGHGRIVTGTVLQGTVNVGDRLDLLSNDSEAIVRGIEVHQHVMPTAHSGERVALQISQRTGRDPSRGMELVAHQAFNVTQRSGAWIRPFSVDFPIKHNSELQLHTGTTKQSARILLSKPGVEHPFAAVLRFQEPIIITADQKFLLRSADGRHTLAAGRFFCPDFAEHCKPREILKLVEQIVSTNKETALQCWLDFHGEVKHDNGDFRQNIGGTNSELSLSLEKLLQAGSAVQVPHSEYIISSQRLKRIQSRLLEYLSTSRAEKSYFIEESSLVHHFRRDGSPPTIAYGVERLVQSGKLQREQNKLYLPQCNQQLSNHDAGQLKRIMNCYVGNRSGPTESELVIQLQLPKRKIRSLLELAYSNGELVHVGGGYIFTPEVLVNLWDAIVQLLSAKDTVSVGMIRDRWKLTRKHAIPLLEYFDSLGLTRRDQHLRKRGSKFQERLELLK
ncbi:selenocysteine-specific translation elongation factor [bacterium]|nr:selenocysteine-specific translation elongation factor [Planctomicrobium sp.]MDA7504000.1 selenocysteine-specific translation elongation factor [bacterium]